MEQKKYMDVVRLGHKSTSEVLNVGDKIVIQEKLDGANASFTLNNGELEVFSRNTKLNDSNTLGGFYNFVMETFNDRKNLLEEDYIYFGEWLNPHKVKYEGYEKQFFLFDIYSKSKGKYLPFSQVKEESLDLGLNLIPLFYEGEYKSFEQLEEYIGKSKLNGMIGEKNLGEGIVVKNIDYLDKFGKQLFVKLVVDEFREVRKQKKAKNPSEYKNTNEYILAESLTTIARIEKIIYKLRDEGLIKDSIDKKHFATIFKECNIRSWKDILKEESDSITEDIDYEKLRKYVSNLSTSHVKNYLMSIGSL